MATFLQTQDGDLDLGSRNLTIVSDAASLVAQRLTNMFRLWSGEWFLDTSTGFPWFSVLGKKFDTLDAVRSLVQARVLAVPGVKGIDKLTLDQVGNRGLLVTLRVRTATELVVGSSDQGFIIQSKLANNPTPVLAALIPDNGLVGAGDTTVGLITAKTVPSTKLLFDGSEIDWTRNTPTSGSVVISGAYLLAAGVHTVQLVSPAPGGGVSATRTFSVRFATPTITSVAPSSGTVGTPVTVSVVGTGLSSSSIIFVKPDGVTFIPLLTTFVPGGTPHVEGTFTPSTAGNIEIYVTNPTTGGGGGASNSLFYTSEGPFTTAISPGSGLQNQDGTTGWLMSGGGFDSNKVIVWGPDNVIYTPTAITPTQIQFNTDARAFKYSGALSVRVKDVPSGYISNGQNVTSVARTILDLAPDLTLWLDAAVGVTKDGSNKVSNWADQSGSGGTRDVSQATSANQPLWVASSINGRPCIRFSVANATRLIGPNWSNYVTTGLYNIWMVVIHNSGAGIILGDINGYRYLGWGATSPFRIVGQHDSTPTLYMPFDYATGPDPFLARFRHTGGIMYGKVNRLSEVSVSPAPNITTGEPLSVGGRVGGTGVANADVGEIIITKANRPADHAWVENYLLNKWLPQYL